MKLLRAVLLLLLAGFTVAASQDRPAAPPVFRSSADLVQVDVSVLDRRRVPIKGLTAADFTVLENGQPRPVDAFAAIDLPEQATTAGAAWTRDVPPDVVTNRTGVDEGRIVVILMDRTIPVGSPTTTARRVAAAAVEALGPGDLGALVSTSGGVPQNLTADRARLIRAINQRDWSTGSSAESAEIAQRLLGAVAAETGAGLTDLSSPLIDGRCLCGLCALETVTNVASSLESMPRRRKSLLFIGSSIVLQAGPQDQRVEIGCGLKLEDARKAMWRALDRSGVTVHAIDPTGLSVVGPTSQASSSVRGRDGRGAFASAVQENLQAQGSLGALPERTGGRVVMNTNGPETRIPEIIRESQSYYVLGYRPADPQVPGQSRAIEVKINRRDVTVHARREYVVPALAGTALPDPKRRLGEAIRSILPIADSALAMSVSAFAAPGRSTGAAVVAIDLTAFAEAVTAGGEGVPPLSVAVAAYDLWGRSVAVSDRVMTTRERVGEPWLETVMPLELPPGEYDVRVAVTAEGTGRSASVFGTVTMPPFQELPLVLSHIAVSAASGGRWTDERFGNLLPVLPTTRREFGRSDTATAFMRVYQGTARTEALEPVSIVASITDAAGTSRGSQVLVLAPAEFRENRAADCRITLPVTRLEPGEYLLSVAASVGPRTAGRAIRFRVR